MSLNSLNNIFQDSFNKILSQQLTHDSSYISQQLTHDRSYNLCHEFKPFADALSLSLQLTTREAVVNSIY